MKYGQILMLFMNLLKKRAPRVLFFSIKWHILCYEIFPDINYAKRRNV